MSGLWAGGEAGSSRGEFKQLSSRQGRPTRGFAGEYELVGRPGLRVSRIGFGSALLGLACRQPIRENMQKSCWVMLSGAVGTRLSCVRKSPNQLVLAPTMAGSSFRALEVRGEGLADITFCARLSTVCADWGRIILTSTTFIIQTPIRRLKRLSQPWMTLYGKERSVTSDCRPTAGGNSLR